MANKNTKIGRAAASKAKKDVVVDRQITIAGPPGYRLTPVTYGFGHRPRISRFPKVARSGQKRRGSDRPAVSEHK